MRSLRTDAERIQAMNAASAAFYAAAVNIGVHRFIELNGLIREFIATAQAMVDAGGALDDELPLERHNAAYIVEKLGCIYGKSRFTFTRIPR